jgi:hypothetical protein
MSSYCQTNTIQDRPRRRDLSIGEKRTIMQAPSGQRDVFRDVTGTGTVGPDGQVSGMLTVRGKTRPLYVDAIFTGRCGR